MSNNANTETLVIQKPTQRPVSERDARYWAKYSGGRPMPADFRGFADGAEYHIGYREHGPRTITSDEGPDKGTWVVKNG